MLADGDPNPDFYRSLQRLANPDRATPRAFYVDQRPVAARLGILAVSLLRNVPRLANSDDSNGREHVRPAVDDPERGRSQPKTHDDVDANYVHGDVYQFPVRSDHLLAGQQRSQHRTAVSG